MFSSIELAHVDNLNKVGLKNFERLVEEHGILSIAGHSNAHGYAHLPDVATYHPVFKVPAKTDAIKKMEEAFKKK